MSAAGYDAKGAGNSNRVDYSCRAQDPFILWGVSPKR
jgi:hypothetical protein